MLARREMTATLVLEMDVILVAKQKQATLVLEQDPRLDH